MAAWATRSAGSVRWSAKRDLKQGKISREGSTEQLGPILACDHHAVSCVRGSESSRTRTMPILRKSEKTGRRTRFGTEFLP